MNYLAVFLFLSFAHQGQSVDKPRGNMEKATLAGGCFWCMEPPFEKLKGVQSVVSGYMGGDQKNPTYEEVSSKKTNHVESVQIIYDPKKIGFSDLLNVYWRNIKPTQKDGQFNDKGPHYRTVIFYHNEKQKQAAEKSKRELEKSKIFDEPIVTEIQPAKEFYPAEDYHQDYYKKNPLRYKIYRTASRRDRFIKKIWGQKSNTSQCEPSLVDLSGKKKLDDTGQCKSDLIKKSEKKEKQSLDPVPMSSKNSVKELIFGDHYKKPEKKELKSTLSSLQYYVTQKNGTEKPFDNLYWNHHEKGIYVDIVSREPLFSSLDKFDSKTGWPSFTKPIDSKFIHTKKDNKLIYKRVEVRSKNADSHLGHVFNDGPQPTGLRYCINSASLHFVSLAQMEEQGYRKWVHLFK